jgi:hypothetical protein
MASPDDDVLTMPRLTVKAGIGVAGLAARRWTPVMGDPQKGWPPA